MRENRTTRRRVLGAAGLAVAAGSLAGCTSGSGGNGGGNDNGDGNGDGGGGEADFDGWFDNVSNYDGVVDETGASEVTVDVGAGSEGLQFEPAAVRVDAGTTVVWKWTGKGGGHNVVAEGGEFESDLYSEAGETFEFTFESAGTYKYYCNPHRTSGMKAAVVVE